MQLYITTNNTAGLVLESAKLFHNVVIFDNLYLNPNLTISTTTPTPTSSPKMLSYVQRSVSRNAYKAVFETLYRFADYF
jgi:hypothetical protein